MFNLSMGWIKIVVAVVFITAVGATIYGVFQYVGNKDVEISRLIQDNSVLASNNTQLTQAIDTQQATIARLQRDIELQAIIFRNTNDQFERARNQVDSLRERLGRHELGALAVGRPGLVENVINNATAAMARCFEIASGSPLTTAERNATMASQVNRECPALANPNYGGN